MLGELQKIAVKNGLRDDQLLAFQKNALDLFPRHETAITEISSINSSPNNKVDALFLGIAIFGGIVLGATIYLAVTKSSLDDNLG